MKIALLVDEREKYDSPISWRLGDAPYIVIYDTEKKNLRFIPNPYTYQRGGIVHFLAAKLGQLGVKLLVTSKMPSKAKKFFDKENIEIKIVDGGITIKDALEELNIKVEG